MMNIFFSSKFFFSIENSILPYDHRQHIQPNGTLIIQSSQKRLDEGSYYCYFDEHFSSTANDNNGKKSNNNIIAQNKDLILKNGAATVHLKVMGKFVYCLNVSLN